MNAIILAGGESSRMGQDKAFIKIDGMLLIKRQIILLKRIFKKIIIVANSPQKYRFRGIKLVQDIIPNRGPLGGIYSGLVASNSTYNFVIACDMPFINEALIRYMIKNRDNYDVLIPRIDGKFHPLFGIYSKDCIPVIEKKLKQKNLHVSSIFPKLKTNFMSKKEIKRVDPDLVSLVNINTKEDLTMLKVMIPGANRNCAGVVSVHKEPGYARGNIFRDKT